MQAKTTGTSGVHVNGEKRRSFNVKTTEKELINNETTQALSRMSDSSDFASALLLDLETKTGGCIDWKKQKNKERLKDLCKLIRTLYWAFKEVETETAQGGETAPKPRTGCRGLAHKMAKHEAWTTFFLIITFYALFGPDTAATFGHTHLNQEDLTLAVINTIVLFCFVLEAAVHSWVLDGYVCSGRFWIDLIATASCIGDSLIATELLASDAFVALRGSRLTKVLRVGGRSTRLVRLLRVFRTAQVMRLIPRLQAYMQRSTNELAFLLWHKRLKHVYKHLDSGACGKLSNADLEFFHTAMSAEFPDHTGNNTNLFKRMGTKISSLKNKFSTANLRSFTVDDNEGCFPTLVEDFLAMPEGKRAYSRCKEDIECMKESCAIVEQASGRVTLKICLLVLSLLVTMQLLMSNDSDLTMHQGLYQMDDLAMQSEVSPEDLCAFVHHIDDTQRSYAEASTDDMLLLVLNAQTYWKPGCKCCNPAQTANSTRITTLVEQQSMLEDYYRRTGLERHEILVLAVPSDDGSYARSLVMFDTHKFERSLALNSLIQTITVVIMLTTLVLYFATDMKKLSNDNVLHPLWNLMDDMCSMKSIEVLSEKPSSVDNASDPRQLFKKHFRKGLRCRNPFWCCGSKIPIADELLQLRQAFDKLHLAMVSWSKYVPIILLKQLMEARIEASIGCSFCEVSVVFLAIHDFQNTTEGMGPKNVLNLMSSVLNGIYFALDNNNGTMLEFIGDEVLAIFNAPNRVLGFELNAITAALDSQDSVRKLGIPGVRLECSVHKARVLAGNLGSPTRMKYGVLGDGVNLSARLKALNTRYDTSLLVSTEGLDFKGSKEEFVTRTVGHLILKGRSTPTVTTEVLCKREGADITIVTASAKHQTAFDLYLHQEFSRAKELFTEVNRLLAPTRDGFKDKVSQHFIDLCVELENTELPLDWDGSELLKKKKF